nr:MAG TPA: hypothetical protein [Podoviridae sp. ctAVH8]
MLLNMTACVKHTLHRETQEKVHADYVCDLMGS